MDKIVKAAKGTWQELWEREPAYENATLLCKSAATMFKVHSHLMVSQFKWKSRWHLRWHPMLNGWLFNIKWMLT